MSGASGLDQGGYPEETAAITIDLLRAKTESGGPKVPAAVGGPQGWLQLVLNNESLQRQVYQWTFEKHKVLQGQDESEDQEQRTRITDALLEICTKLKLHEVLPEEKLKRMIENGVEAANLEVGADIENLFQKMLRNCSNKLEKESAAASSVEVDFYTEFARGYCCNEMRRLNAAPDRLSCVDCFLAAQALKQLAPGDLKPFDCLYYFKRYNPPLPRVANILGALQANVYSFDESNPGAGNLLDVASQKGKLLFPILDNFPDLHVTSIDIDDGVIAFLSSLELPHLRVLNQDVQTLSSFDDGTFNCVTCSEIFEHLPDPHRAAVQVLRVVKQIVICTVPAKPEPAGKINEEHIQLFYHGAPHNEVPSPFQNDKPQIDLQKMWMDAGAESVTVSQVSAGEISVLMAVIKK